MNLKDDPNTILSEKTPTLSPSSSANQAKLQEEARTTVIDGTPSLTCWQETKDGYVKHPVMPKPANLRDIKVNY